MRTRRNTFVAVEAFDQGRVHRVNADQPVASVLDQVLRFVSSIERSVAPQNPRVLLIGPPGAGKRTLANMLANKYSIIHISAGNLIREAVRAETKAGLAMRPHLERGLQVPDSMVLQLVTDRMEQLDCQSRGWVLTGFPKTQVQAENLQMAAAMNAAANRVFFIHVPSSIIVERLSYRVLDPVSGEKYHAVYNPPQSRLVHLSFLLSSYPLLCILKLIKRKDIQIFIKCKK